MSTWATGDPAGVDVAQQPDQRRHVVDVLQHLAHGLQHDREARVATRHLEQGRRPLPLLPQRAAPPGIAPRQQQRPGGALAEPGGEQRRTADLVGDQLLDLVRLEHEQLRARRVGVGLRDAYDDAVVAGDGLTLDPEPFAQPGVDRERPGCVHLQAERRVQQHPPVAELVAEALDQQGAVVRHVAGGLPLLGQEGDQVVGRPDVEPRRAAAGDRVLRLRAGQLADEPPERLPQLGRTAQRVALPERQPPRLARCGTHHDPVVGDVLDPPAAGAEREHVADAGLVDHLLVELADPPAGGAVTDEEHPEQPAVGDGAAGGDRQPLGARTTGEPSAHPVPDDAGPQLGELLARVAAGQQVEGRFVGRARQRAERRRPAGQRVDLVDVELVDRRHRHDLLGEDVERVGGHRQLLDRAGAHPLHGDGCLEQVGPVLGQDHPAGDLADLVAGAPDPLHAARDRRRRLDLHDQVDGTHVDAELETAGGHHAGQPAGLEVVLDQGPLLLAHRSVVGAGQQPVGAAGRAGLGHHLGGHSRFGRLVAGAGGGDLVEPGGEPLGQPPGVGEHDRRPVLLDQVDDVLLDVGPDRRRGGRIGGRRLARHRCACRVRRPGAAQLAHVLDRDDHRQVELLVTGRLHHPGRRRAAEEARDLVGRPHRGRQPDPLGGTGEQRVEPLERQGEVGAPLGAGDRVHLVDDHRVHAAQRLAGPRGEHQEQRLGGGDQHVGWLGGQPAALVGRGVSGAGADPDLGRRQPQPPGGVLHARQGGPQVALDVDRERLQRRDVEHPAALLRLRGRGGVGTGELVEAPQERRQRLARPGRRHHQRVLAGADRVPGTQLGRRRLGERAGEPLPGEGREPVEHGRGVGGLGHGASLPRGADSRARSSTRERAYGRSGGAGYSTGTRAQLAPSSVLPSSRPPVLTSQSASPEAAAP